MVDHCLNSAAKLDLTDLFFWSALTFLKQVRELCLGLGEADSVFPWVYFCPPAHLPVPLFIFLLFHILDFYFSPCQGLNHLH